ncbi:MAG: hypothetical protein GY811_28135 [Myxococcales bacterium]|nr:hypothetical protein [Myxococcales bacterium]
MNCLELIVAHGDEGQVTLKSPGVGYWRRAPAVGHVLSAGQPAGVLSTLGREQKLVVPTGVRGVIIEAPTGGGGQAVAFGDALMVLGEAGGELGAALETGAATTGADRDGALVFCSISSGRFYLRPAPEEPAFVAEGDIIEEGQTVFLLEVMKTFSRVTYGGPGQPAKAKVLAIAPSDGDDLEAGQVVLRLEAIEQGAVAP